MGEFYAETVQKAVAKAASDLGVAPEDLEYSVLDEGSSGFLGIGARDARIEVRAASSNANVVAEPPLPSAVSDDTDLQSSLGGFDPLQPTVEELPVDAEGTGEASVEVPNDLILKVDDLATKLLEGMGLDATVDAYDAGEVIKVDVATKEAGLLIGQKGETIDAIQYLLNVIVYKNRPFLKRISVDIEGYRQRRIEALQGMAHRTARRAQREGRPLDLPPMAAAERRVVHMYLKSNPNVSTISEGNENDRRVVVVPNDQL